MALTNAEKQQRWRDKRNAERLHNQDALARASACGSVLMSLRPSSRQSVAPLSLRLSRALPPTGQPQR
jgi:hypothetical protein